MKKVRPWLPSCVFDDFFIILVLTPGCFFWKVRRALLSEKLIAAFVSSVSLSDDEQRIAHGDDC
jgi:hypothetical protein